MKTSVHVAPHYNETSLNTTWQIPEPHFLEDWSDARSFDGTVSIIQPLIAPLYNSHSLISVLDAILQYPGRSSYEIVRAYWSTSQNVADFESWWRKSVHDGLIAGSALLPLKPSHEAIESASRVTAPSEGLELVFRPDVYMYDGRYANNVWLQELPHPMTKLTWDNPTSVQKQPRDYSSTINSTFG